MTRFGLFVFAFLLICHISLPARGVTIRYALVIGNNIGVDETGRQPFPPLKHAEREALALRDELIGVSNFDASSERTRLLQGATRKQVFAAVRSLAEKKAADEHLLGQVDSLFLIYFTGHGLEERLLLEDGPLTAKEIGDLVGAMAADFTVGIFDACYSGSLESTALSGKGIDPTPGLNMFHELPEEVFSAEGSVWYVSSGPRQESYEDEHLGGVFTHFFIEALRKAAPEGPGIPLESIWQYARQHTVAYTAERKRAQLPERYIAKMRSGAPVYFSFPLSRSASLVLSEQLNGRFALSYADGHLTEVFEKQAGKKGVVAVYPGKGRLMLIQDGDTVSTRDFYLASGDTLVLSALPEPLPPPGVGQQVKPLQEKGTGHTSPVRVTTLTPGLSVMMGVGYGLEFRAKEVLGARHNVLLPIRLDFDHIVFSVTPSYGMDRRRFTAWGYRVHRAGVRFGGGVGWDAGILRMDAGLFYSVSYLRQIYDTQRHRDIFEHQPTAAFRLLLPRQRKLTVSLFAELGPVYTRGSGVASAALWFLGGKIGLAMNFRLF